MTDSPQTQSPKQGRTWIDDLHAKGRAEIYTRFGVGALIMITCVRVIEIAALLRKQTADDAMTGIAISAGTGLVALVCVWFAWQRKSRVAMLVGAAILAFDWTAWALGLFGGPRLSLAGFAAQGLTTIMLLVGLSAAIRFHQLHERLTKLSEQSKLHSASSAGGG